MPTQAALDHEMYVADRRLSRRKVDFNEEIERARLRRGNPFERVDDLMIEDAAVQQAAMRLMRATEVAVRASHRARAHSRHAPRRGLYL